MDRTERQKLGIKRWIDAGGRGVLQWGTGVGKTYGAIMLIKSLYNKNSQLVVLIGVPTDVLKNQWQRELAKHQLFSVCKVEIFNTIVKNQYNVDLFIVDECHSSAAPIIIHMYECVFYKYILGLTATWERLDGGEKALEKYMSICDTITLQEALQNGWVSPFRNYKVLITTDLSAYNELNRKFQNIFSIFNYDFKLVMGLVKSNKKRTVWSKVNHQDDKKVRGYLAVFMKLLKQRKSFVISHPKKFELANKILDCRKDKKCIVFTATVKDAEKFRSRSMICHSQRKKVENKDIISKFNNIDIGTITSPRSLETGVDISGLSVGIALTCNSSQVTQVQKIGRVCRYEADKKAEFFTLIIANSVEETWFNNSNKNQSYITINESQLDEILNNKEISLRPKRGMVDIDNRF